MLLYILVLFNTIISFIYTFELFKTYKVKKKLDSIKKNLNTEMNIDTDFWEGLDINDIFTDK